MNKKPYVIGLDLGGTNSVFGIVDKNATIVKSVSIPTAGHGTAEKYVKACTEALLPLIAEVGGIEVSILTSLHGGPRVLGGQTWQLGPLSASPDSAHGVCW